MVAIYNILLLLIHDLVIFYSSIHFFISLIYLIPDKETYSKDIFISKKKQVRFNRKVHFKLYM